MKFIKESVVVLRKPRVLCINAVLVALGVVLGFACRNFTIGTSLRVTVENLPVILSGILFGPFAGAVTGALTDLLSSVAFGYSINPIITLGAASVGAVSGLLYRGVFRGRFSQWSIFATELSAHAVGSCLIKSLGLYLWFGTPWQVLLLRLPLYLGISAVEALLLWLLLKNESLRKELEAVRE